MGRLFTVRIAPDSYVLKKVDFVLITQAKETLFLTD
jgi:hypothetical protein